MKYSIVYSSNTGNTRLLAEKLKTVLTEKSTIQETECVYYGAPDEKALNADLIFAGFWTDKGDSDKESSAFLESLHGKKVFLFGTAGFGGSETYFNKILSNVKLHLDDSNTVEAAYMCQGKMPVSVRQRYESMLPQAPEKMQGLIDNFDLALSHPDENDLDSLARTASAYLS